MQAVVGRLGAGHLLAAEAVSLLLRGAFERDRWQLLSEVFEPLLADLARHQVCEERGRRHLNAAVGSCSWKYLSHSLPTSRHQIRGRKRKRGRRQRSEATRGVRPQGVCGSAAGTTFNKQLLPLASSHTSAGMAACKWQQTYVDNSSESFQRGIRANA
eukprot:120436-Chlamydomonas_euryale.AAC.11